MFGYSAGQVQFFIFFLLDALAGIAAIFGWVLPMDDGSARFRWRFIANGLLACAFFSLIGYRAVWWSVANVVLGAVAFHRSSLWWRKSETARKQVSR